MWYKRIKQSVVRVLLNKEEKLDKDKEKREKGEVSRRDFLVGAGAVVVGGAIGAAITYPLVAVKGDGEVITTTKTVSVPTTVTTTVGAETVTTTKTVGAETVTSTVPGPTVTTTVGEAPEEPEETFMKAIGLGGFGGAGEHAAVDVKNGRVVRIRPLHYDEKYTKEEIGPWKIEARGKTFEPLMKSLPSYFALAYKKRAQSPNRTRFPLKRVDWEPGGVNVNPQNRGKSKFKRISWDEATGIIASEVQRVQAKYGPYAIITLADGHGEGKGVNGSPHGCVRELLEPMGGYTQSARNPDSWEGWFYGAMHVWGTGSVGHVQAKPGMFNMENKLLDISENTDMIVWQGGDWETTPQGFAGQFYGRVCYWFTDIGIKQVYVAPEVNYQNAAHSDKWIPVLPNTDVALQMAIAYTWIDEDTYDKGYIATHAVGFDEYIKPYLMGDEDGVPKTPKWASPLCGIPVWTIKALAREWASKPTSTGHYFGGAFIRGPFCHEPARWECVLLGMQGLGKPGVHQIHCNTPNPPRQVVRMGTVAQGMRLMLSLTPQVLPKTLLPEAILNPPLAFWGSTLLAAPVEDQFVKYVYPIPEKDGGTELHMIWQDNPCHTACWTYGNKFIDAVRSPKIECYVVQHPWLENDMLYADILLPATTKVEEEDLMSPTPCGGMQFNWSITLEGQAVKPVGESKSDWECVGEVAKKLGLYEVYSGGMTVKEWIRASYEGSGAADFISWEELNEKGYYIPPTAPDWKDDPRGMIEFYEDPVANPLGTPSGKLEFYSARLAEYFPDDKERGPYPKWIEGSELTHDERLSSNRAKDYPLLIISNHPRWRHHVQCDDLPWLREIPTCKVRGYDGYMYEAVWLHPTDAAQRGIESGDIVKVYNEKGIELGGAYLTQRIMPGAVYMDHGARVDMITDRINRGGTVDLISPDSNIPHPYIPGVMVCSGYLVEVEKVTGEQMGEWRSMYPEAFARDYDPAAGLTYNSWVEGGM